MPCLIQSLLPLPRSIHDVRLAGVAARKKFGDSVNAKKECSQFNEVLLKILCHNVVVVIHELRESNIDPGFLADDLDTASELVC